MGQVAQPGLTQGDIGDDAQVDRLQRLFWRQSQTAGCSQDASDTAVGHVVEPDVLESGGVADAAKDLVGDNSGGNGAAATLSG